MGHLQKQNNNFTHYLHWDFSLTDTQTFHHLKSKSRQVIFAEDNKVGNLCSSCRFECTLRGFQPAFYRDRYVASQGSCYKQHIFVLIKEKIDIFVHT